MAAVAAATLATSCTVTDRLLGSEPDRPGFCLGAGFEFPRLVDVAVGQPQPGERLRPGDAKGLLRRLYQQRFVDQAPPGGRAAATTVRQGAIDAQDGHISKRDRARYIRAFRRIEREGRTTCDDQADTTATTEP